MLTRLAHVEGWHVVDIAQHIRPEDAAEIEAISGFDPLRGLSESVLWSTVAHTIMAGETPVAIYGARRLNEKAGLVWLLASDRVHDHATSFLRNSREYADRLHDETGCRVLRNFTDSRNKLHHKWLRFSGFSLGAPRPMGPQGIPFIPLSRTRKPCAPSPAPSAR